MKRRTFLKSVGAGIGYLMLPTIPIVRANSIYTAQGLTSAMEKLFTCKAGNHSAFIEFTRKEAMAFFTPEAFATIPRDYEVVRLVYQTFAYAVEGGSAIDAEAKLAQYFYEEFQKIAGDKKPMLVWRLEPHFVSEPITKYGDTWMTKEQIEDRTDLKVDYVKSKTKDHDLDTGHLIQWAYTVPSTKETPPIMVPEGVEYDFNTDSLRYVKEKTMLHKMRMRLNIPEVLVDDEYHALAKPEGSYVPKLETHNA